MTTNTPTVNARFPLSTRTQLERFLLEHASAKPKDVSERDEHWVECHPEQIDWATGGIEIDEDELTDEDRELDAIVTRAPRGTLVKMSRDGWALVVGQVSDIEVWVCEPRQFEVMCAAFDRRTA